MCNLTICVKFGLSYLPGRHRGSGERESRICFSGAAPNRLNQRIIPCLHQPFACPPSVCPSPSASSPLCPPRLSVCLVAPIPVTQVSSTPDGFTTKILISPILLPTAGRVKPCEHEVSVFQILPPCLAIDWPGAGTTVITNKSCNYKSPLHPMA